MGAGRLTRSTSERVVAGVCGGIARRLHWDPTLVRFAFIMLTVATAAAPGVFTYVILWATIPQDSHC